MPERGRHFSMGLATLFEPVAVAEERFVAATENLAGEKKKQKMK